MCASTETQIQKPADNFYRLLQLGGNNGQLSLSEQISGYFNSIPYDIQVLPVAREYDRTLAIEVMRVMDLAKNLEFLNQCLAKSSDPRMVAKTHLRLLLDTIYKDNEADRNIANQELEKVGYLDFFSNYLKNILAKKGIVILGAATIEFSLEGEPAQKTTTRPEYFLLSYDRIAVVTGVKQAENLPSLAGTNVTVEYYLVDLLSSFSVEFAGTYRNGKIFVNNIQDDEAKIMLCAERVFTDPSSVQGLSEFKEVVDRKLLCIPNPSSSVSLVVAALTFSALKLSVKTSDYNQKLHSLLVHENQHLKDDEANIFRELTIGINRNVASEIRARVAEFLVSSEETLSTMLSRIKFTFELNEREIDLILYALIAEAVIFNQLYKAIDNNPCAFGVSLNDDSSMSREIQIISQMHNLANHPQACLDALKGVLDPRAHLKKVYDIQTLYSLIMPATRNVSEEVSTINNNALDDFFGNFDLTEL